MYKRRLSSFSIRVLLITLVTMSLVVGTAIRQAQRQAQKDKTLQVAIEASNIPAVRAALREGANPNAHWVYTNQVRNFTDAWLWLRHDEHIFWHDAPVIVDLSENGGDNDPAIMSALIQAGADVNSRSDFGQTALMNAAGGGRRSLVSILLQHGADPNLANKRGATATDLGSDYKEILAMLHKAGAK